MKIIAHRGGASLSPENTLTAFRRGISEGADMIEIDIHLSSDGHIIVCHDQTVDRTTDGNGRIRDFTLLELRQFHVLDADGVPTQDRLPTLEEVFQLMREARAAGRNVQLLVEIKRTRNIYQGLEERLLEQIYQNDAASWVTVQSFNDFALEHLHELDPTIRLEKLLFMKLPFLPYIIDGGLTRFSYDKYSYVRSFNFWHRGLTASFLRDLRRHQREVKLWTLEGTDTRVLPVDGIITNRPDLWVQARQENPIVESAQ